MLIKHAYWMKADVSLFASPPELPEILPSLLFNTEYLILYRNLSKIHPWAMNELKCMAPHKRGVCIFQELWYEILPSHTQSIWPCLCMISQCFFVVIFCVCVCVCFFLFCFFVMHLLMQYSKFCWLCCSQTLCTGCRYCCTECCGDNKWWFPFLQDKMASKAAPKKNGSRGEKL